MNNPSETPLKEIQTAQLFNELFIHAHAVIGRTPDTILTAFPNGVSYYRVPKKKNEDTILQIPVGSLTLSCIMDKENCCEGSYIFLDITKETDTLNRLVRYCNRTFHYHYIFKIWYTEESTMELKLYENRAFLSISKKHPLPEILREM